MKWYDFYAIIKAIFTSKKLHLPRKKQPVQLYTNTYTSYFKLRHMIYTRCSNLLSNCLFVAPTYFIQNLKFYWAGEVREIDFLRIKGQIHRLRSIIHNLFYKSPLKFVFSILNQLSYRPLHMFRIWMTKDYTLIQSCTRFHAMHHVFDLKWLLWGMAFANDKCRKDMGNMNT